MLRRFSVVLGEGRVSGREERVLIPSGALYVSGSGEGWGLPGLPPTPPQGCVPWPHRRMNAKDPLQQEGGGSFGSSP